MKPNALPSLRSAPARTALCLLLLALAALTARADDGDDLDPRFSDQWKWFRPGMKVRVFEYDPTLVAPLPSRPNNFFHHLLHIPPLEAADLLPAETFLFSASLGHAYNTDAGEKPGNRFRARFTEGRFALGLGLGASFEARAGFNLARFSFEGADDLGATQEGAPVFPPDGFAPGLGLGDIEVGLKIALPYRHDYDLGLAAVLTVKIPVGDSDFLSSGRGDFSMAMAVTYKLRLVGGFRVFFHLNAGWAFFDEENVFPAKVYVNSAAFYGLSIVAPFGPKSTDDDPDGVRWSVILQCYGHENAFARLDQYNSSPASVHGGLRAVVAGWTWEAGLGFGVTQQGSSDYVIDMGVARSF